MSIELSPLIAKAAANTTIVNSVWDVIKGLAELVAERQNDPLALRFLLAAVDHEGKQLADAVIANTKMAPEVVPAPAPDAVTASANSRPSTTSESPHDATDSHVDLQTMNTRAEDRARRDEHEDKHEKENDRKREAEAKANVDREKRARADAKKETAAFNDLKNDR